MLKCQIIKMAFNGAAQAKPPKLRKSLSFIFPSYLSIIN